jgi:hypothetical protein
MKALSIVIMIQLGLPLISFIRGLRIFFSTTIFDINEKIESQVELAHKNVIEEDLLIINYLEILKARRELIKY